MCRRSWRALERGREVTASPAGYSGKSLAAKLGVKPGARLLAIDAPVHYPELVAPLPEGAALTLADWDEARPGADIVHAFFKDRGVLAGHAAALIALAVSPGCALWVSWPKKASPLFSDLTDNAVREIMLPTGWVDVKVAAVDADWSGLKFLMRKSG
jgi:hypothetical protein